MVESAREGLTSEERDLEALLGELRERHAAAAQDAARAAAEREQAGALRADQASRESSLAPVQEDRGRVTQVTRLVERNIAQLTASWCKVQPELEAAHRVLPADAFLYRIQINREAVTIRGEAPRASDVLERLESSAIFSQARSLDAPLVVEERGAEQFHIRAQRTRVQQEGAS